MLFRHPILSLVTVGYLAIVGWLTLGPQPLDDRGRSVLQRIIRYLSGENTMDWITYNLVEFVANIAMFLPVGVLFVLLLGRRKWWLAILLGVALTAAIEFAQLYLRDRVTDPRDILANSIGAVIGVLLALIITAGKARRLRKQAAATARERVLTG